MSRVGVWRAILDDLPVRPVDEDAGEQLLTCQAHELTRLVGGWGKWTVVAVVAVPDDTTFAIRGNEAHIDTVAIRNRKADRGGS